MSYAIKITGLANKKELLENTSGSRLYKFKLNQAPDGLWVLLLQQAGFDYSEVTLSASAEQVELWASADQDISVKHVLSCAQKAVRQANNNANESQSKFDNAEREKVAAAAAFQATLVAELDELDFDEPAPAPAPAPAADAPSPALDESAATPDSNDGSTTGS